MRTISYKLDDLKKVVIPIGYEGENNHTRVIIDAGEVFKQYPEAAVALTVQPPKGTMYPAIVTRDGDAVTWDVKDSDCASNGNGEAQFTFTNSTVVVKSVVTKIKVQRSLHTEGQAPDPIQSWLDTAEETLEEADQAIEAATEAAAAAEAAAEDLEALDDITKTALAGDVGKALSPKTVENGVVTEWQFVEPGAGTDDYTDLDNKPSIAGVTLSGNKTLEDLGIAAADDMDNLADDVSDVKNDIQGLDTDVDKIKDATIDMSVEPSGQDVDISTQLTYENGKYVNKSGYVGIDNQYKCTNKIAVEEGEIYKTTNNYTTWRFVCAYNGDTAVESKGSTQQSYTVPAGITHIIITLYSDIQTNSKAVVKQSTTKVYSNNAVPLINAEATARASADEAIEEVTIKTKTLQKLVDISEDQTYVLGQYINTSGYNGLDANYNRTEKIAVNPGETYKTLYKYSAWRYVCAYNGNTAVSEKGASNVYSYTVPEGITHIVLTLYNDLASLADRVIARVDNVTVRENSADPVIQPGFVKRKARVTFIDDDGYKEFATYMTPIMEEKGVPMCVAYMGDLCPTFKQGIYMTEAECKEVEDLGGEIVVHGGTNLTQFATVAEAEANVLASKNALEAHGFRSDVYVYPESGTNIELREMLAKYFKCAFKTGHPQKNDTRVNDKCVPHFFIHRCSAGGYYDDKSADYGNYDTWTMDYFEALIDDAVTRGGWLVFMTHAWMMPIGSTYRQEHDAGSGIPADLDEFALIGDIIDYILELKQGGTDIDIVTASEGFEIFKNEVQAGDYLGYWNETYTDLNTISRFWHDKAGFAVNKVGDIDFADGNRISHS